MEKYREHRKLTAFFSDSETIDRITVSNNLSSPLESFYRRLIPSTNPPFFGDTELSLATIQARQSMMTSSLKLVMRLRQIPQQSLGRSALLIYSTFAARA